MSALALLAALLFAAVAHADPVDLNRATLDQLNGLPGVGPSKAAAVIAWRERHGPFQRVADLEAVPGFGVATLASLRAHVRVGRTDAPVTAPLEAVVPPPHGTLAPIDPNTATVEALATWPGIDTARAQAILADRSLHGPFTRCEDLLRVVGIGPATLATLDGLCTIH